MANSRHPALRFCRQGLASIMACLLMAASVEAGDSGSKHADRSVVGRWKILSILDFAQVSIGEAPAKKLLGKELLISVDRIEFGDRHCQESDFHAESVETNIELSDKARVSNDKLRLPNPVTVVELSCAYVYVRNKNRLVFAWNGIFFDVVRMNGKNLTTPPSSQPLAK